MMMRIVMRVLALCLALVLGVSAFGPARAQSDLFTPVVRVNGLAITHYELDQRIAFLTVLRAPGDLRQQALEGLISDRLRLDAAKALGVTVSDAEITSGMAEFAGRAKVSTEEFVKGIGEAGVDPETFRDFVRAGALWRAVLRAKFAGRVAVSAAEVDRAIAQGAGTGGVPRVQLSEIVMPDDGSGTAALTAERIHSHVKSAADFAMQAKLNSKVPTASGGGALGWMDVSALPPDVAGAISALKPGEMTGPLHLPGAIGLYFLQARGQGTGDAKGAPEVDYALLQAPDLDLAKLHASVTTCDQLFPLARGRAAEALQRQTVAEAAVPAALRATLAGLDAGESAVVGTATGAPALLMLCARRPQAALPVSREVVMSDLVNQKVSLLADAYLEELRSRAIILQE